MEIPKDAERWLVNGVLHREDGPAVIYPDGTEQWYLNGRLHRTNGPAVSMIDGEKQWWAEWWVDNTNITIEVDKWMQRQHIKWPWDEETQAQFLLTFSRG